MLRLGVELPAAGDLADFDAALVGLIGGDEKIEPRARDAFLNAEGGGDLVEGSGLVRCLDDGFERGLNFFWRHGHRYCSSIFDMASGPAKTASNILCFRSAISANSSD